MSVGADLMNEARHRYYPGPEHVSYMVFGGNSENAHAAFLEDGFDLSCRWFHLYPVSLDSQFSETLDCARREKPELVLITLGFFDERAQVDERWGGFVGGAKAFLDESYAKVAEGYPGFEVWRRTDTPS